MITGAKAVEVTEVGLRIQKEAREELLPADSIVIATGSKSENALASLKNLVPELYVIGDANQPRNALEAVREGFLTGVAI
jgi:2,4-dienoyl-CoA reductase (NADPH2)